MLFAQETGVSGVCFQESGYYFTNCNEWVCGYM